MHEISPVVEEWREQGRAQGREQGVLLALRETLIRLGQRRFRRVSAAARRALEAISDRGRLERMIDRILDAESWQDLLDTP